MKMPGNMGPWRIAPGQVTDDSEMAMCQLQALCEMEPGKIQPIFFAKWYQFWYQSRPFDMGITTQKGLAILDHGMPKEQIVAMAYKNVLGVNFQSQSNGSLMRCTPMAVFCHKLEAKDMFNAIVSDVKFTHSNPIVHQVVFLYCYAISLLLKGTDGKTAFDLTYQQE